MKKLAMKVFSFLSLIGLGSLMATATNAATDADLQAGLASGTAMITDNKGAIISFIIVVFTAVLILSLIIVAISWAIRQLRGVFVAKKRRG